MLYAKSNRSDVINETAHSSQNRLSHVADHKKAVLKTDLLKRQFLLLALEERTQIKMQLFLPENLF